MQLAFPFSQMLTTYPETDHASRSYVFHLIHQAATWDPALMKDVPEGYTNARMPRPLVVLHLYPMGAGASHLGLRRERR